MKASKLVTPLLILPVLIALPLALIAQNNLQTVSSPVNVISAEQINRTVTVGDLTKTLTFNSNHVLTATNDKIDLRGLGTNKTMVLVNGKRIPAYTRCDGSIDPDIIPAASIDKIEVLQEGSAAVYGNDAIGGVVNFILKKDVDLSGERNNCEESWQRYVSDIFSRPNTNSTTNDNTFGNGKMQINIFPNNNYMIETRKYFDPAGIVRLDINRQYERVGTMLETKDYFDCSGIKLYTEMNLTEPFGYTFDFKDIKYKDGQADFGFHSIGPGKELQQYRIGFDPSKNAYQRQMLGDYRDFNFRMPTTCNEKPKNMIMGGLNLIREDAFDPFWFTGGYLNYTRKIEDKWGIGVDLSVNVGDQNNYADFTKINLRAGPEYFPCKYDGMENQINISPFAYIGITNVSQKIGTMKNSTTNLSGLAGANIAYLFTEKLSANVRPAISPTFFKGGTSLNYEFALGLRYRY